MSRSGQPFAELAQRRRSKNGLEQTGQIAYLPPQTLRTRPPDVAGSAETFQAMQDVGGILQMRKFIPFLVTLLVATVSWIFFKNFTITGLGQIGVVPRPAAASGGAEPSSLAQQVTRTVESTPAAARVETPAPSNALPADEPPRIRIATFNIQVFDQTKSRKPEVLDILARIGREFDVLAVQEIQSQTDDILPRLVNLMNKTGQQYDYAIGPRVGPAEVAEQYGFVFNRKTVQVDRVELYTVDDRDNLFTYEPYVGWFRTVGPPANEAFTFSLINLRIDPTTGPQERKFLSQVIDAVRNDGRNEDDIILAGDFQAGPGALGEIDELPEIAFAAANVPTNVMATDAWDNVIFHKTATGEFTGNSGVFDFLRLYNLSLSQALEISDHLPVWAEFHLFEGGAPGRVAAQSPPVKR